MNLGDFELTIVSDGTYPLDGGAFFGVVPKVMWSRKVFADERNFITAGLNSLLIRTGKQNILVETGMGSKLPEKMVKVYGQPAKLLDNLQAAGISPDEIDIVINTHLHFDHCGWNTVMKDGVAAATFPNARYYAPEGEWLAGQEQRERDAVSYIDDNYGPLVRSGQMQLLREDGEITPGISVWNYPGHTRAMVAVMIESAGNQACFISDLIPTTAHLDLVWGMAYDLFPLETIENKKRYYRQAIPEKWLTIFPHDPQVPWGYLELNEQQRIVVGPLAS